MRIAIVYVANADSGEIAVLRLDEADGALTPVQRVSVGGMVMPMAVSPDRRFLYAARRSEPMAAISLAIDPRTGMLTRIGEAALPASMAYIATDHSGRFLLSASYPGHLIAVSPIAADGTVQATQQIEPTPPNAHAIRVDRSNRFVFATSLGGGVVMQWCFDVSSGRLTPNVPPTVTARTGATPRHLEFHPNGRFVYVINERDAALDVFVLDAARGTLGLLHTVDSLPPGFAGEPWAADLHIAPEGRFLYASERRSSTITTFRVDPVTGRLSIVGHTDAPTQPRGFAIAPDGRFLLCAGQLSNQLRAYTIDAHTGVLTAMQDYAMGAGPNWVEIVRFESSAEARVAG